MEKNSPVRLKREKTLIVWSFITLALVLVVPLIYWDALGSGAMHFMRYSNVNVAGSSAGDSHATFFFGILYTIQHMGPGVFIPSQLFSAQWRVVMNTTEASAQADTLGAISLILVVCMLISLIVMIVLYTIDRHAKKNAGKAVSAVSLLFAILELVTAVWFGFIVITMATKVSNYGFRIFDFLAYGGAKCSLEVLLNLLLGIKNLRLFSAIKKEAKAA
ncbi:MAG: hypothetical protein IJ773_01255 [Lachnospiraceae bacterium]|nr:hypothetical protein [Lachnospiraceae bacterium]